MELAVTREQTAVGTGRVERKLGEGTMLSLVRGPRQGPLLARVHCGPVTYYSYYSMCRNVPQCGAISRVKRSLPSACCGQWTSLTRTRHNSRLRPPSSAFPSACARHHQQHQQHHQHCQPSDIPPPALPTVPPPALPPAAPLALLPVPAPATPLLHPPALLPCSPLLFFLPCSCLYSS